MGVAPIGCCQELGSNKGFLEDKNDAGCAQLIQQVPTLASSAHGQPQEAAICLAELFCADDAEQLCKTMPTHHKTAQQLAMALNHPALASSTAVAKPAGPRTIALGARLTVAVVGGGISGLLTAKWVLEEGLEAVIFEASERLGGIWAEGSARVYPTLHSNTARSWMHFSDFEFPQPSGGPSDFPHHSAISAQVAAYIERFNLAGMVELNSRVESVSRSEDGSGWILSVGGKTRRFDRVCLCNGQLQEAVVPNIPVQGPTDGVGTVCIPNEGRGTLAFHSSELGSMPPNVFAGCHVLIVGFGQASGSDVAELAAKDAASVTILSPKALFLLPRLQAGRPNEDRFTVVNALAPNVSKLLTPPQLLEKFPAHAPEDFTPGLHAPTRVWTLHELIGAGRVSVRLARLLHCRGGRAALSDGSELPADVVVWCTGYASHALDILEPRLRFEVLTDAPLYEGIWPPSSPGLAFIGHDEAVWYFLEVQARWVARVWSGTAPQLPDQEVMRRHIGEARARVAALPRKQRLSSPLTVHGEDALAKLMRMAVLANIWPNASQVALKLFSIFEPRFVHGVR